MPTILRSEQKIAVDAATQHLKTHAGILIADDTGFGKSWEALAIAASYNEPIAIICPASLKSVWAAYLRQFNLHATILSHTKLGVLQPLQAALLLPTKHTLIVDEAHAFVSPNTQRYRNLSLLALHHRTLLLTATPFQNKPNDILHLLAIIDGRATSQRLRPFNRRAILDIISTTTIARRRPTTRPLIRRARQLHILPQPYERLASLLTFNHEPTQLVAALLLKRALSSPAALQQSAQRLIRYLQECLDHQALLPRATFDTDFPNGQTAFAFIHANQSIPSDITSRIQAAEDILQNLPREHDQIPYLLSLPKPLVLFTCYKATADHLFHKLSPHAKTILWTGERLISNHWANISPANLPLNNSILIATDVANTGINLDDAATLVHIDLPWNPHVSLQREGRITRSANFSPATIITFRPPPLLEESLNILHINSRKESLRNDLLYLHQLPKPSNPIDWASYLSPKVQQLAGLYTYTPESKNIRHCINSLYYRSSLAPAGVQNTFRLLTENPTLFHAQNFKSHLHSIGFNVSSAPYPNFTILS